MRHEALKQAGGATNHREALKLYERIRGAGSRPSISVILAALKACSSLRDLESGRQIHESVLESGDSSNLFVSSTLVDMYAKCGAMVDASRVFEGMQRRNLVAWNCIILGYASNPSTAQTALQLFWRMQDQREDGLEPNRITFLAAIKACSSLAEIEDFQVVDDDDIGKPLKIQSLNTGKRIHFQAAQTLMNPPLQQDHLHIFVANALVELYAKCGSVVDALQVFEGISEPSVVSWNSIVLGLVENGLGKQALKMFRRMQTDHHRYCSPDAVTLMAALKACTTSVISGELTAEEAVREGEWIHRQATEMGVAAKTSVTSSLIEMYSKCGRLADARSVFEAVRMIGRDDVVSWTAMIMCYAQAGEGALGLHLFWRMRDAGVPANHLTYVAALKSCLKEEQIDEEDLIRKVKDVHGEALRNGAEKNLLVGNALIDAYARFWRWGDAWIVFMGLKDRSLVSWNCVLQIGMDVGLDLLEMMKEEGFEASAITYVAALKSCGSSSDLGRGRGIAAEVFRAGMISDVILMNALLDFYAKCGSLDAAQIMFDSMSSKDVDLVTWNSLVDAYSRGGEIGRVFELLDEMQKQGVLPDEITLLSVLTACSHGGDAERGKRVLRGMKSRFRVVPGRKHYGCLIDMLGRANRLEEAVEIVRELQKDDARIWMNLLAGCHKWKNMVTGRIAFENVMRLGGNDAAAAVLMSNIYSSAEEP